MKTKLKNSFSKIAIICAFFAVGLDHASAKAVTATKTKDEIKSPLGCKNAGYQYDMKVIKLLPATVGASDSLYFFYNKLNKPVALLQMLKDDGSQSLHLNHVVQSKHWAALATSEKSLKYICTIDDGSTYGEIVDCERSIKVCEYAGVTFGLNNRGNLWLVKSNTRGGAVQEVLRYGIIPR